MSRPKKYPDELVQRGVRLALESERPIAHKAADLGMHPETLRKKVRQAEADCGGRPERSLPVRVSGALRCSIPGLHEVVSFDTHGLSAGPDLSISRSERGEARHLEANIVAGSPAAAWTQVSRRGGRLRLSVAGLRNLIRWPGCNSVLGPIARLSSNTR